MRKALIVIFLTAIEMFVTIPLSGQYDQDEDELPGRFFISPDLGLVFGTITRIEVSPSVGYHITPAIIAGIGGRYEYYREKSYYTQNQTINTNIYGFRVFSRLILFRNLSDFFPIHIPLSIFGHAEYEFLNLDPLYFPTPNADPTQRYWLDSFLAGGGISQRTSKRTYFNIMVLWDLTNTSGSPYVNPILKFGIQFYLFPD